MVYSSRVAGRPGAMATAASTFSIGPNPQFSREGVFDEADRRGLAVREKPAARHRQGNLPVR